MAENSQLGFRYAPAKLSSKYEFTQKFGLDFKRLKKTILLS